MNEDINKNDEAPITNDVQTQTNDNWDFYNQTQSVAPKKSNGGSNQTAPHTKAFNKRRNKQKQQKNSRRINRKH